MGWRVRARELLKDGELAVKCLGLASRVALMAAASAAEAQQSDLQTAIVGVWTCERQLLAGGTQRDVTLYEPDGRARSYAGFVVGPHESLLEGQSISGNVESWGRWKIEDDVLEFDFNYNTFSNWKEQRPSVLNLHPLVDNMYFNKRRMTVVLDGDTLVMAPIKYRHGGGTCKRGGVAPDEVPDFLTKPGP